MSTALVEASADPIKVLLLSLHCRLISSTSVPSLGYFAKCSTAWESSHSKNSEEHDIKLLIWNSPVQHRQTLAWAISIGLLHLQKWILSTL